MIQQKARQARCGLAALFYMFYAVPDAQ